MKLSIDIVTPEEAAESVKAYRELTPAEDRELRLCLTGSSHIFRGTLNDNLVNVWGLIPPTLISNQAYLWLFYTEHLRGNEFIFVRHSQRMVREMLAIYPRIVGVSKADDIRAQRWITWLGGNYASERGGYRPFMIQAPEQAAEAVYG